MKIELKKFGATLTSRQSGKEAYSAFLPSLNNLAKEEIIEVDFDGVNTFSPSWGDEFLTVLVKVYGDRVLLANTSNLSVQSTIRLLEEINKCNFKIK